jgi:hypothetical protein
LVARVAYDSKFFAGKSKRKRPAARFEDLLRDRVFFLNEDVKIPDGDEHKAGEYQRERPSEPTREIFRGDLEDVTHKKERAEGEE